MINRVEPFTNCVLHSRNGERWIILWHDEQRREALRTLGSAYSYYLTTWATSGSRTRVGHGEGTSRSVSICGNRCNRRLAQTC